MLYINIFLLQIKPVAFFEFFGNLFLKFFSNETILYLCESKWKLLKSEHMKGYVWIRINLVLATYPMSWKCIWEVAKCSLRVTRHSTTNFFLSKFQNDDTNPAAYPRFLSRSLLNIFWKYLSDLSFRWVRYLTFSVYKKESGPKK